jgi:hypothetical protein
MPYNKLRRVPLAAAALLACMSAQAEYSSPDGQFSMSGFGTLGFTRSGTDDALFNSPGQGGGAGKSGSATPDSKVAVQGTYKFSPTVSATAQLITKYDAEAQYVPSVEWAFAKWQITPQINVRAGRMGAPFFMVSDFRDVGYANTAIRPNLDVYGQVPVSNFEGADVTYQTNVGSASLSSTLWAGNSNAKYASALSSNGTAAPPSDVDIKRVFGVNLQAEFDSGVSLRFGHAQGKLSVNSSSANTIIGLLSGALAGGAGPTIQGQALALKNTLTTDNADASFTGIGVSLDRDNIVAAAEFTKRKISGGYVPDTTGWYTLVGYRFGKFLPYVSLSKLKVDDPNAALPSVSAPLATAAGGAQAVLNTQKIAQRTASLGLRWDVSSGVAVKTQFDRITKPADSNGLFLVRDPVADLSAGGTFLKPKKNISVLSVAVDFVF